MFKLIVILLSSCGMQTTITTGLSYVECVAMLPVSQYSIARCEVER